MDRRKFLTMMGAAAGAALTGCGGDGGSDGPDTVTLPPLQSPSQKDYSFSPAKPRNIVFIAVDDQNDWIGPLGGYRGVHTPAWDALAARSTVFESAYCTAPLCGPSRNSVMWGFYPWTTGTYWNNDRLRDRLPDAVSLPQHLAAHGYSTTGFGKIFHANDRPSWNYDPSLSPPPDRLTPETVPAGNDPECYTLIGKGVNAFDWAPMEEPRDEWVVDETLSFLREPPQDPWFLGVGITPPHLAWYVPGRFFDLYPLDSIRSPLALESDWARLSEIPRMNWTQEGSIHRCMLEHDKVSEAIRGYLAATSYADDMLGRIVRAVPDDAVIVIWSDHGFHLGQKFHWQKAALWETSTRVPFMIRHPGGLGAGNRIKTPVSLIDIFPTVTEIAGVPASAEVEGLSLAHMIEHPRQQRGAPAAMGFTKDNYALRAHQYRYIRYRDGEEELYDHRNDPLELENLADSVRYAELKADLATYLPPLVIKPPA